MNRRGRERRRVQREGGGGGDAGERADLSVDHGGLSRCKRRGETPRVVKRQVIQRSPRWNTKGGTFQRKRVGIIHCVPRARKLSFSHSLYKQRWPLPR